MGVYIENKWTS